jgi:hypothetical protein
MIRYLPIATIALAISFAGAFTTPLTSRTVSVTSSTARHAILTEDDVNTMMKSVTDCAAGECSVDDVNDLLVDLREQRAAMEERLKMVDGMINKLVTANDMSNREVDDVRQLVRDFLRVFSQDKPLYPPSGWPGEVGDGPKTAYDVLPPKPYKD